MRIPGILLEHSVGLRLPGKGNAEGITFTGTPLVRSAHVEETSELRVDERTTSDSAGTEIPMRLRVILQLERTIVPGTLVTYLGRDYTAARVEHREHSKAPSNTEVWAV